MVMNGGQEHIFDASVQRIAHLSRSNALSLLIAAIYVSDTSPAHYSAGHLSYCPSTPIPRMGCRDI